MSKSLTHMYHTIFEQARIASMLSGKMQNNRTHEDGVLVCTCAFVFKIKLNYFWDADTKTYDSPFNKNELIIKVTDVSAKMATLVCASTTSSEPLFSMKHQISYGD